MRYAPVMKGLEGAVAAVDAHMPGLHLDVPNDFVKVVVKLKV